jgi:SAM-dependent methyltransferase
MPETVRCNLCGADDARPLFRRADERLLVDDVEWAAVRCRRCGLGYLNPRPTRDEIGRYYPGGYFDRRATMRPRYERQARYVPGEGGRLLDVGTARGDFLAVMRDRGWDVVGVEPAEAGNPHGLEIHRVPFPEGCDLPDESFDVVTAWAVFEHLYDPASAFDLCASLLRPGGTLIVQVPNLRSAHARWAEDVPRHLYFFSEPTLRRYGERSGLVLERVIHTTDLFGGSGRGLLRLWLVRALRRSDRDFFEIYRAPKRERFRRWPALSVAWTAVSAVEHVVLADAVVRRLRISGQVVARFRKPEAAAQPAPRVRAA